MSRGSVYAKRKSRRRPVACGGPGKQSALIEKPDDIRLRDVRRVGGCGPARIRRLPRTGRQAAGCGPRGRRVFSGPRPGCPPADSDGRWPVAGSIPQATVTRSRPDRRHRGRRVFPDTLDDALRELRPFQVEADDPWGWLPSPPPHFSQRVQTKAFLRQRREDARRSKHTAPACRPHGAVRLRSSTDVCGRRVVRIPDPPAGNVGRPHRDVMARREFCVGVWAAAGHRGSVRLGRQVARPREGRPTVPGDAPRRITTSAAGRGLLAKSGCPGSQREREEARRSTSIRKAVGTNYYPLRSPPSGRDDLILHLTGTHHGDGRPFAAPYNDNTIDRVNDLLRPT